jgi:hypothetical protein
VSTISKIDAEYHGSILKATTLLQFFGYTFLNKFNLSLSSPAARMAAGQDGCLFFNISSVINATGSSKEVARFSFCPYMSIMHL